ncbi:MAG: hypothetical protein ABIS20_10850, partial [Thermoanaerobaculia bacterium]
CSSTWQTVADDDRAPEIPVCRSVGWLHHDGDDCKVIIPHLAEATTRSEKQGCGEMAIPTKAILRLVDLEIPQIAA